MAGEALAKVIGFIVDDHELIRRVLRRHFEDMPEFRACGQAMDACKRLKKFKSSRPASSFWIFLCPR
jgi:DNA-binding NarL/FixJ family response regulator